MPNELPRHLVLFDGTCALCHGFVRWTLRRDRHGRFAFAPLQGATAHALLAHHAAIRGVDSIVVVLAAGTEREHVLVRSDAVLAAGREIGGVWRALAGLGSLVPRRWRDTLYDFVAARRYRTFGRYATCPLPPPAARARFLE